MTIQRRLRLAYALAFTGAGMGLYAVTIYNSFSQHPRVSDHGAGNVVPFAWKGMTVFISERERLQYISAKYISLCTLALAAIVYLAPAQMGLLSPFHSKDSATRLLLGLGILAALFFAAYDLIALFQTGCVDIFNIGIFCGSDAIVPAIGQTALYGLIAASFAQLYFRKKDDAANRIDKT